MNRRSSSSISRVKRTMKHATTVLRQFAWLSILSIVITNNPNNNHSVVCAFTFIGLKSSSISFRIQNHKENNQRQRFQQAHQSRRNSILPSLAVTTGNNNNNNNNKKNSDSDNEKTAKQQQQRSNDETEKEFLEREIEHLNSLEELLAELEEQEEDTDYRNDGENTLSMYKNHNDDDDLFDHDEFIDFFGSLPDDVDPEELAQLEQEMMFLAAEADDDNDDDGIDDGDDYDFDLEFENEDDMNDFVEDFVDEMSMEEEDDEIETTMEKDTAESKEKVEEASSSSSSSFIPSSVDIKASSLFEDALLQGVVPADAGVGKSNLPGDFGFDPFNMATKDYIRTVQSFFWNLIPGDPNDTDFQAKAAKWNEPRPPALILRDYREAEIRHGRLAMMAAMIWPLQEMLDRLLLEEYQYSSTTIVYGGVTLPYLSLFMTLIMMLLGYLDIYANVIKDMDDVGEAFLPGDCFWDPLSILEGAPATMKRNMQERELFNGRFAMIAIAFYVFEEATTHKPIISIPGNELLFEPAYQISYIQSWLDSIFASPSPVFVLPDVGSVDFADAVNQVLQEEETVRKILQDGGEVLYTDIP